MKGRTPTCVAEIGTAHGGDTVKGLEMIAAAAEAGADVVKVQVVFAGEILPPLAGMVPLPGGERPLFEIFKSLERPAQFYAGFKEEAERRGMEFLGTAFGERSAGILEELGAASFKVASPELNHEPLLKRLAATGKPLILSTGVSTLADVERALDLIRGGGRVTLLHCVTSYPAPEEDYNLRLITTLRTVFGVPIGLSDHSLDPVLLPALSAALGAVMVEKHFTLDRKAGGLDDSVALDPEAFALMSRTLREFAALNMEEAEARLAGEYGPQRVRSCLGDGIKRLAPSEAAHYGRSNRSLHALGPLAAGTILTPDNTAVLRTEKRLRPGIPPRFLPTILGRRLSRDVPPDEGLRWEDLLSE